MKLLFGIVALLTSVPAQQPDWPQWGGPGRDFRQPAIRLAESWPTSGPRTIWSRPLGGGHGGIAVADGVLYTLVRRGANEVALALSAVDGSTQWRDEWRVPERELDYGMGPFSTPLVLADRVLFFGVEGELRCLRRSDGERLWSRDLHGDYPGSRAARGHGSNPLLCDGRIVVLLGAAGAGAVALEPSTGATVWRRHDFDLDYASPIAIERAGDSELVCQFESDIVGLGTADGELRWRLPADGERTRHVITPLDLGDGSILAVTSKEVRRVTPGSDGVAVVWRSRRIRPQVGNLVLSPRHGLVLGASSASTGALLVALDAATGAMQWRDRAIDAGYLWLVGEALIALARDGVLAHARFDRAGLEVLGRHELFAGDKIWSAPAMVGTTLFAKDDDRILALDLGR